MTSDMSTLMKQMADEISALQDKMDMIQNNSTGPPPFNPNFHYGYGGGRGGGRGRGRGGGRGGRGQGRGGGRGRDNPRPYNNQGKYCQKIGINSLQSWEDSDQKY